MRILQVLGARRMIGGQQSHVLALSEELLSRGHEVTLVSSIKSLEHKFARVGIKHYTLPLSFTLTKRDIKGFPRFLFSIFQLINIVRREGIDVIHSHAPSSSAYVAYIVSRMLRRPIVYTVHGASYVRFFWTFFKYFGGGGNAIIAISEEIRDYVCSRLKAGKKIYVINNGIRLDRYIPTVMDISGDNTKKIIHISRLDKEKTEATVKIVNAVPEIVKIFSDVQLVIVGDGERFGEVAKIVEETNTELGKRIVRMLGFVEPEEIPTYLYRSDIVIGAGRIAIEGMSCGKPVIVASSGGFGGALTQENREKLMYSNFSGRDCIGSYNSRDVAESVVRLLTDPASYDSARETSITVASDLDIKKIANRVEEVYLGLLK